MDKTYARKLWKEGKKIREKIILAVLKERSMSAYELAAFLTGQSSGYNIVVRGPLKRLEKEGYVTFKRERRKKNYEITELGISHLIEHKKMLIQFANYIDSLTQN